MYRSIPPSHCAYNQEITVPELSAVLSNTFSCCGSFLEVSIFLPLSCGTFKCGAFVVPSSARIYFQIAVTATIGQQGIECTFHAVCGQAVGFCLRSTLSFNDAIEVPKYLLPCPDSVVKLPIFHLQSSRRTKNRYGNH